MYSVHTVTSIIWSIFVGWIAVDIVVLVVVAVVVVVVVALF